MRLRGVPIGAGVQLPAQIKNSKSIIGLTRDKTHAHDFEDYAYFDVWLYT